MPSRCIATAPADFLSSDRLPDVLPVVDLIAGKEDESVRCQHMIRDRRALRKGQVLSENDRVCFEVDEFSETLDRYASVLIEGRLVPVSDLDEKARVKQINDAKYNRLRNGHRPGHGRSTALEDLPMRRVIPLVASGRKKS
jgi:hypothetical protein